MEKLGLSVILSIMMLMIPLIAQSKEGIPDHAVSIEQDNTYKQLSEEDPTIEPSEEVKALLADAKIEIDNPALIKLLNESTFSFSFCFRVSS
ncbi:hypothetical protein JCM21714_4555 [Gracilibacillus boraciitolerans JCM 21714]|uniref:Uncharacterized protein n=1 Tax=Gracilibacillus boraciitolerans JCM 21714 TaxID=1298598 RepID=W4VQW2_9BACI|nr:YfkD family protein [Gracilibacillus boraciitolerans]GAE95329.1 hypothetical protein JCM21714_4555 [Gracilibacillus boraciitolerans JCM 21714]